MGTDDEVRFPNPRNTEMAVNQSGRPTLQTAAAAVAAAVAAAAAAPVRALGEHGHVPPRAHGSSAMRSQGWGRRLANNAPFANGLLVFSP